MNSIARQVASLFRPSSNSLDSLCRDGHQIQQWRGIRVKVINGNLEQALRFMEGKMKSSGIERMIKRVDTRHIKDSEKRILARKNLQRRLQSQELSRKLKSILIKKVRGL
ncbi:hypothetical protein HS088_TW06G00713 [Tripterygium wilfordii]|uniref:Ribosomal protein S21 family protein n=1 Tax=Tripterygium wilfordii TaxID=458696 RepID=A0A7J7DJK7_TRIWF|nr:uncharacterized protein LOC120000421 [Tripterygium wilfordii]KAF5746542.1 hypothetical protein HS088_TW06G00713 [Tripterygium wilfordii]